MYHNTNNWQEFRGGYLNSRGRVSKIRHDRISDFICPRGHTGKGSENVSPNVVILTDPAFLTSLDHFDCCEGDPFFINFNFFATKLF